MRILKFCLVGALNTVVDYVLLNVLIVVFAVGSAFPLALCNVASFVGANLNSYLLNKKWTFENTQQRSLRQYLCFFLCSLGGMAVNCGMIYLLARLLDPHPMTFVAKANLAKSIATFASMAWNFYAYRTFVFAGQRDSAANPSQILPG
jgi:putative flippase GtrA